MNQTTENRTHDAGPAFKLTHADRIVLAVDHHAEQARRSATVTTWAAYRARMHRRNAQVAFSRAWGLR